MISCGVDIVELKSMRESYLRQGRRLIERILTENERETFWSLPQENSQVAFLAKRFAAKEALLKAIKTGLAHGFTWQQIEVAKESSGAVYFKLAPSFYDNLLDLELLPKYTCHSQLEIALSLSDSSQYAIAQVFITW